MILRTPFGRFPAPRGRAPVGYLRDERIEVIDEERVHGVAGVFRPLHNVHVPMLRELPTASVSCGKNGAPQPSSRSYHFSAAA